MFLKNLSQNNSFLNGSTVLSNIPLSGKFSLFEDILNKGLTLRIKVTGKSMFPFLKGGEVLTIKQVPYFSLKKGDLIFFKNSNGFTILHRLISKKKEKNNMFIFQTKGDFIMSFDEPIYADKILGKVCTIEKTVLNSKKKIINMESFFWKTMNYIIAVTSFINLKIYITARKIYRINLLSFIKHKSKAPNH